MILSETVFHRGQAVGRMFQNTYTGQVKFQPTEGHRRLARRKWRNVKACRKAVTRACKMETGQ